MQEGAFHPWSYQPHLQVLPNHDCSNKKEIDLSVFDEDGKVKVLIHASVFVCFLGVEHKVVFHCCECEPVAVAMARARIWPATPQYPRLAFTFDLLDLVEALLLECHVAVKDFCGALFFKGPFVMEKVEFLKKRKK